MPTEPYGFTIFCDDLRGEVGGKISIMGVYQTDYVFHGTFPAVFPKLVVLPMYYEPKELEAKDLFIKIYLPGDAKDQPSIQSEIPRQVIEPAGLTAPPNLESDQQTLFHARLPVILQPFMIKEEGYIKVRIERDGVTYNFGSLYVRTAREGETLLS